MKTKNANAVVKRIDDLGRVVITRSMRQQLNIQEGDPLEMWVGEDGDIHIRKYMPMDAMFETALKLSEAIYRLSGLAVMVADLDKMLVSWGSNIFQGELIGDELQKFIERDENCVLHGFSLKDGTPIMMDTGLVKDRRIEAHAYAIRKIATDSAPLGAVILMSQSNGREIHEQDIAMADMLAWTLAREADANL